MQLTGNSGGITTIEPHEVTTWGPAVAGSTVPTIATTPTYAALITFAKAIRDRRKEN